MNANAEQMNEVMEAPPPSLSTRVACPQCGKMCLRQGLGIHIYRQHTQLGLEHATRNNPRRTGRPRKYRTKRAQKEEYARRAKARRELRKAQNGKLVVKENPPVEVVESAAQLQYCPCCGTHLRPYQIASRLVSRVK